MVVIDNQVGQIEVLHLLHQFETVGVGFEEGLALKDDDRLSKIQLVDLKCIEAVLVTL